VCLSVRLLLDTEYVLQALALGNNLVVESGHSLVRGFVIGGGWKSVLFRIREISSLTVDCFLHAAAVSGDKTQCRLSGLRSPREHILPGIVSYSPGLASSLLANLHHCHIVSSSNGRGRLHAQVKAARTHVEVLGRMGGNKKCRDSSGLQGRAFV